MKEQKPIAIALQYDGKNAPKVTAKGMGSLAEEIIKVAREHGIEIHEEQQLVEILAEIDLGEEIPENLYRAVAEIIAYVYMLTGKIPDKFK